ncbi:MAG: NUDIX hydrolase [Bacteroidota bacterium]
MHHKLYIDNLRIKLNEVPLPGKEAQYRMAPEHRKIIPPGQDVPVKAAVLLLLYPHQDHIHIILTRRPEYNGHHSGQISFPGGKKENSDTSLEMTALRETYEELGISPGQIDIMGHLSPLFIPVSNFIVLPIVGYTANKPKITPDPFEVEKVIETPVRRFIDGDILRFKEMFLGGKPIKIPYYNVAGDHVWGATAMILSEFIELHKRHSIIPE